MDAVYRNGKTMRFATFEMAAKRVV